MVKGGFSFFLFLPATVDYLDSSFTSIIKVIALTLTLSCIGCLYNSASSLPSIMANSNSCFKLNTKNEVLVTFSPQSIFPIYGKKSN